MDQHGSLDCRSPKPPRHRFDPDWKQAPGSSLTPASEADEKGWYRNRIYDPITAVPVPDFGQGDEFMLGGWYNLQNSGGGLPEVYSYTPATKAYTPEYLPHHLLAKISGPHHNQLKPLRFPGVGRAGEDLVFAGGMYGSAICADDMEEAGKVFVFCSRDRSTRCFDDELETKRQAPVIGSSPDGKYVIIAGGIHHVAGQPHGQKVGELLTSVEIFDKGSGRRLSDEQIDQIFGCKRNSFDSIRELPSPRLGGHCVWVQNEEVNRIFFIGGSAGPEHHNQTKTLGVDEPTKLIDVYDVKEQRWLQPIELHTPRNFPGVAVREHPDGGTDIVITGGTTGARPAGDNHTVRPIHTTEILDPVSLDVGFGKAVRPGRAVRESEHYYRDAGPVALAIRNMLDERSSGHQHQNCACKGAIQAAYFGFNSTQIAKLQHAEHDHQHG